VAAPSTRRTSARPDGRSARGLSPLSTQHRAPRCPGGLEPVAASVRRTAVATAANGMSFGCSSREERRQARAASSRAVHAVARTGGRRKTRHQHAQPADDGDDFVSDDAWIGGHDRLECAAEMMSNGAP
jgi:hypothetical protein